MTSSENLSQLSDIKKDKLSRLYETKQDKIDYYNKSNTDYTFSDENLDRRSYTDTEDGYVDNNGNKIWGISEEWTPQENAFARDYFYENYSRPANVRGDRRIYGYGVKDEGSFVDPNQDYQPESYDPVKIGLSSGKFESSDRRYIPELGGWESGIRGVDVSKKHDDRALDYSAATAMEALIHSNKRNFGNRLIRARADGYYDYLSPEGLKVIDKAEKDSLFGSGSSEYYANLESIFDDNYNVDDIDQQKIIEGINKAIKLSTNEGYEVPLTAADKEARINKAIADNTSLSDQFVNSLAGFGAAFANELLVKPLDFIGDQTGLYDIGTSEEIDSRTNEFFGYDTAAQQNAIANIGKQWDIVSNSEASTSDRVRAAGTAVIEALTTPEMIGTSLGVLASWVGPGKFLKMFGAGSAYANKAAKIDNLVKSGKMSWASGKAAKAKDLMSVDGAKALLTSQSGMLAAAMGNVNQQYEEFVRNNDGTELEDADKAKWFAGRFAVQLVNQNLDKITDLSIIKHPGVITSIIPAVKAMTNKEFSKLAGTVAKGLGVTGTNMGKEAAQEYAQTTMELFNSRYGSELFKDADSFAEFLKDERNIDEAGIAALAGAGGAPQFEVLGGVLPLTAGTVQGVVAAKDKLSSSIPKIKPVDIVPDESNPVDTSVPEEEAEKVIVDSDTKANDVMQKYANMFSDDEEVMSLITAPSLEDEEAVDTPVLDEAILKSGKSYGDIVGELDAAETVIEGRRGTDRATDSDDLALSMFRKIRSQAAKTIMSSDTLPTLGSGYSPEDIVDDFLDTVEDEDGNLNITEEEKALVNKFLKKNGQKPFRFARMERRLEGKKDALDVYQDSQGKGKNSAPNRRARIRRYVNTPNINKSLLQKELSDTKNFLDTQYTRKSAYEAARKEYQADIDSYNKNRKSSTARKPSKKLIEGFSGNFLTHQVGKDGKLSINKASKAIIDSIDDTIDHLETTLSRYASATTKLLGNPENEGTVDAPLVTSQNKKAKEYREKDAKFYNRHKPNKVIVDSSSKSYWQPKGDYYKFNESKLIKDKKGTFSPEDKVLLTSIDFKKGSVASALLRKALDAGATVVVDRALLTKESKRKLNTLAKKYGGKVVKVKGTSVILPGSVAEEINTKRTKRAEAKKTKDKAIKRFVKAVDKSKTAKVNERKLTKEEKAELKEAEADARPYFEEKDLSAKEVTASMNKKVISTIAEEADTLKKTLHDIMLKHGTDSKEYSETLGKASDSAIRLVEKAIAEEESELAKGDVIVDEWREQEKASKLGTSSISKWLKDTFGDSQGSIVKDMLDNSLGKAKDPGKPIYIYKHKGTNKFKSTLHKKDVDSFSEDGTYQVVEVDPSKYVTVGDTTPLNTLDVNKLKLEGLDYVMFNSFVEESLGILESTISDKKTASTLPFNVIDSPASSLIFNKDGELNANFAVAANIALYNFLRNSGYLLSKEKKSIDDIANILGKHRSELSPEAIREMQDRGLLLKTVADSIGKDIASMLGLQPKNSDDVDSQAYNALLTEFGQIAVAMGINPEEGILKLSTMPSKTYATKILGKPANTVTDSDSIVNFVEIADQEAAEDASLLAKSVDTILPMLNVSRKEPNFKPLSGKQKKKASAKIRKERLGVGMASDTKEAMETLMDTEMKADMPLLRFITNDANKDRIKTLLGYIPEDSEEFDKLSFVEKETQPSKNRDIEKNFESLEWLDSVVPEGNENISMWFKYFLSKNGRFFIDSNTINPQNNKHLDRFLVQPADHNNTYKYNKGKFLVDGKDVTPLVHYALAQGFGYATDKKSMGKIKDFSTNILKNITTVKKLNEYREEFLDTGEVESLGIEIEHLGHALQSFDFLEKMLNSKGKPFDSPITAEFDAVTSGFALKLLQMPIVGDKLATWLSKVGIMFNKDDTLENLGEEKVSMNNVLDIEGFLDSYQFLANSVSSVSYEELKSATDSPLLKAETGYAKNLWEAVSKVLPSAEDDGSISSELRNLFKYPFMTFNYASSLKSIRRRLSDTMQDDIAARIASVDLENTDPSPKDKAVIDMMAAYLETDDITKLGVLQEQVRQKPLAFSTGKKGKTKGASLGKYLTTMIDASYGQQVENILSEEFTPFLAAQDNINNSFKAMFEVFKVAFEQELVQARKEGPVSSKKEKELYENLKNQWPAIRGPLSNMEQGFTEDGSIGIYSIDTESPYGPYAGRKPASTNLAPGLGKIVGTKTLTTSHMIKAISAAISAGSVIPIHYIDGAVMGNTVQELSGGTTSIHDAIMPSLTKTVDGLLAYNKNTIQVSANYGFIDEIVKSLDRVIKNTPLFEGVATTEGTKNNPYMQSKVVVSDGVEVPVSKYIVSVRNSMASLANNVNSSRKELFDSLNSGSHVMHMAGIPDGVYNIDESNQIEYTEIDRYEEIKDNTEVRINEKGVSVDDLNALGKNHC